MLINLCLQVKILLEIPQMVNIDGHGKMVPNITSPKGNFTKFMLM